MCAAVSDPLALCFGCFQSARHSTACPVCGFDERISRSNIALPPQTVLAGQFLVGKILGSPGGFGITYLGFDLKNSLRVAIKEFLPRECAARGSDHCTVFPVATDNRDNLDFGLSRFIEEAKILFELDHPNIVKVRRFFEENNTAYIVMDYYEGVALDEHIARLGHPLDEAQTLQIILPLLDGLKHVHAKGLVHRDIKPANIYLTNNLHPILLDFGAARFSLGERTRSLTLCLTPGFAPFEQHQARSRQGPWTDIYAIASTMYFMLTKQVPPAGVDRALQDKLVPLHTLAPSVSPAVCLAISHGMEVKAESRPQTINDFRQPIQSLQNSISGSVQLQPKKLPWLKSTVSKVCLALAKLSKQALPFLMISVLVLVVLFFLLKKNYMIGAFFVACFAFFYVLYKIYKNPRDGALVVDCDDICHRSPANCTGGITITFLDGYLVGESLKINKYGVVIGRSRDKANVVLSHSEISNEHVRVSLDGKTGGALVQDLGSTNGTFYCASASLPPAEDSRWVQLKGAKVFYPNQGIVIRLSRSAVSFVIS